MKFVGKTKKAIHNMNQEAVLKSIKKAHDRLNVKYLDEIERELLQINQKSRKLFCKPIDVGKYFSDKNTKINEPIRNIVDGASTTKGRVSFFRKSQLNLKRTSTINGLRTLSLEDGDTALPKLSLQNIIQLNADLSKVRSPTILSPTRILSPTKRPSQN